MSLTLSVCLFVTDIKLLLLFWFLDGIEPFLGHQFSMTKTTKRSSIFDSAPPPNAQISWHSPAQNLHKIAYKSACMADRPEMFGPTIGGFRDGRFNETMQNVVGPTLVAVATKFGLGAEIQSPTGLYSCLRLHAVTDTSRKKTNIIVAMATRVGPTTFCIIMT